MTRVQLLIGSTLTALASAAGAHPGHPTLDPNHTHGAFEADPITLILLAAAALAAAPLVRSLGRGLRGVYARVKRR